MREAIKTRIITLKAKRVWRKKNPHNHTTASNAFDEKFVSVGRYTYGPLRVFNWGTKAHLSIGDYCSIAQEVTFLLSAEHHTDYISTFPFKTEVLGQPSESFSRGDIVVDDDVWICYRSTILSGVHIGQGAIVAAGSVVTKNVPPYAIVGGVPAKVIKYRFSEDVIDLLLKIDYNKLNAGKIRENLPCLYSKVCTAKDVERIIELFKDPQ